MLLHFTRWHPAAHPSCWAETCRVKRLNGPFHEFSNKTCLMFENNQCYSILGSGPSITPHTSAPSAFNLEADFTRRLRLRHGSCDLACAELLSAASWHLGSLNIPAVVILTAVKSGNSSGAVVSTPREWSINKFWELTRLFQVEQIFTLGE